MRKIALVAALAAALIALPGCGMFGGGAGGGIPATTTTTVQGTGVDMTPVTTTTPVAVVTEAPKGIASQAIDWLFAAVGATIAAAVAGFAGKVVQGIGFQLSEQRRARLQDLVHNGLALAAKEAGKALDNRLGGQGLDAILSRVVSYVNVQGGDTLKKLGMKPNSPEATEAIVARALRALEPNLPPPVAVGGAPAAVAVARAQPARRATSGKRRAA